MDGEILQKPYIKWKIVYLDSGNINYIISYGVVFEKKVRMM